MAYESFGDRYDEFPRQQRVLYDCRPIYEELPGWNVDISGVRDYDDLPKEARRYVETIEAITGVPVTIVSVGPGRSATLRRT